ncbi:rhombotarget lipoprotein [Photobacterium sp.]|uniref:rhombotarget lipoprotein n=1 Tax=Photobacterium sp. TaxID=660 RepID=UPI00299CDA12|nr:rhombotarget lipoprotein [Photobacterium sp.]MDX1301824.1 rhombotarget lipoprotein [Photobacterium sp.]
MNLQIGKAAPYWMVILVALISGCAGQQIRTKSSVVDYLYPTESEAIVQPSIPVLNLPVKVGIAFVPEQSSRLRGVNMWSGVTVGGSLTEANKTDLLEKVAENFRGQEFVSDIEVIPSAYLAAGGGFSNLEQIRTMYGIDIIALVSYDQIQFTDEGLLSLAYWTLVGAYVISGEKNDTSTMLDTAVYDIQSKNMLFRAPGTSNVKGSSTPINLSEELRKDSVRSYDEATDNMISNLEVQLEKFKEKIKQDPEQVKVVHREGYSGGSIGLLEMIMMFLLFGAVRHGYSKYSPR